MAFIVELVGGLRGRSLPCGGCQGFESAYLQFVNLADTKLYDSTRFFQFGSLIYDFSFMDVDINIYIYIYLIQVEYGAGKTTTCNHPEPVMGEIFKTLPTPFVLQIR